MIRTLGIVVTTAAFIGMMPALAQAAVFHQGKVTSVGVWQIGIQDASGDNDTFEVDTEARIIHNGKPASLGAIDSGDVAKLTLKTKKGRLVVTEIDARDRE